MRIFDRNGKALLVTEFIESTNFQTDDTRTTIDSKYYHKKILICPKCEEPCNEFNICTLCGEPY
jgi:hypothetical protein